jgi:hypothetical protein
VTTPIPTLPRRDRCRSLRRLVPDEVVVAHERVRVAARRPGTTDPGVAVTAADDVLLEVAALLAGRQPDGEAQVAYVAARTSYLDDLATALEERGDAWRQATIELDSLSPADAVAPADRPARDGLLVGALLVALSPFFLLWDLVRGVAVGAVAAIHAVGRALRSGVAAVAGCFRGIGRSVVAALRRWRSYRDRIAAAVREARARVVAARLRLRLRLRRLRAAR